MADIKFDMADMVKWAGMIDRVSAYYAAIVKAGNLVNQGKLGELETEIATQDETCRKGASDDVACYAYRGLKQIESCHKSRKQLKDFIKQVDRMPCPETTKAPMRAGFALGASAVESVCRGYFESAITYIQTIQRLGLMKEK